MESSNTALRSKNDEAAARELSELRADTIEGLKYALDTLTVKAEGVNDGRSPFVLAAIETGEKAQLRAALDIIERRWPA